MDLKEEYEKKGFVIIKGLLSLNEVNLMRNKILEYFCKNPSERKIFTTDIMKDFQEIYEIQTKQKLLEGLKEIFGKFYYVNDYQIQKNLCSLSYNDGWHIDAESQYGLRYLNHDLGKEYRFAKIGLYLNKDEDYGKSIDIIPYSHKGYWIGKIILKLIKIQIFRKNLVKVCDENILPGDCIIFDSRVLHRPARAKKDVKTKNHASYDINERSKLTVYFEVGSKQSAKQFIKSNLCRAVIDETSEVEEKPFSDYLRLKETDFPEEFLKKVKNYGGVVTLDEPLQKIAEQIYGNCAFEEIEEK